MINFDEWLALQLQADDPYGRDILELGVRVADCFVTHGSDPRSLDEYLEYWFGVATLEAMVR